MGKRSVKTDKTVYQLAREKAGLSREKASEKLVFLSPDRIERIESRKSMPEPDEIIAMAAAYGDVRLANRYCTTECPIGRKYVPPVGEKNLPVIALEVVNALNVLEKEKNRLIEIAIDDRISEDEASDFREIEDALRRISSATEALKLWIEERSITEKQN